jgi:hypothetical protein
VIDIEIPMRSEIRDRIFIGCSPGKTPVNELLNIGRQETRNLDRNIGHNKTAHTSDQDFDETIALKFLTAQQEPHAQVFAVIADDLTGTATLD